MISKIKYNSFIIIPSFITIVFCFLDKQYNIIDCTIDLKISVLVSISATLIGVLLTILTIYASVPKRKEVMERMKKSGHQHIYISNIMSGIVVYFISIIIWLFGASSKSIVYVFIFSVVNTVIVGYYTINLIKSA